MAPRALLVLVAWALLACAGTAPTPTLALTFPTLTGRVVDEAGLLDATARAALTESLAELERKTTDQLVVVTLKSLQGTSIEDYGYQLGRQWQIGQKGKNNGVLLIVAPNERKVRVEVGYGLEGELTDAIGKFIVENSILPRFKAGDYAGGIKRGVEDLIQVLGGDAKEWQRRAAQSSSVSRRDDNAFLGLIVIILLVCGGLLIFCAAHGGAICRKIQTAGSGSTQGGSFGGISFGSGGGSSGGESFSGGGGSFGGGGASGSW